MFEKLLQKIGKSNPTPQPISVDLSGEQSKVRIFYLRDERRFPVACIASKVVKNTLVYAVATYNPRDAYDRALARSIAEGRLQRAHFSGATECPDVKTAKANLVTDIVRNNKLPQRTRDAAALWLTTGVQLKTGGGDEN